MLINSGLDLHYPLRIVKIRKRSGDAIKLGDVLFEYEYTTMVAKGSKMHDKPTKFYADFASEGEGVLKQMYVKRDQSITGPGVRIVEIEEECTHEVQWEGMCTICGKDMEEITYMTTTANTQRAQINMAHGSKDLKVSAREASRTSTSAMKRLLRAKKLSLVVDLDQTIIHAVCDPTVAEWQRDVTNPNHEAVKDVESFDLLDEGFSGRASTYYIKSRPGLSKFLADMAEKYELHIYTMGTRAYAENVAKIVDPTGRFFGDRILSRDESGSMSVKNLSRLFPVDTKMVVIIDDRGDVWTWSPNLVRVKAYVFYVGIGDINSSFLPKLEGAITPSEKPASPVSAVKEVVENAEAKDIDTDEEAAKASDESVAAVASDLQAPSVETAGHLQAEQIAAQVQDRPLLKLQASLDKQDEEDAKKDTPLQESSPESISEDVDESMEPKTTTPPSTPPAHRHPLLRNDDDELSHLTKQLSYVHGLFYSVYDANVENAKDEHEFDEDYKVADDLQIVPDIAAIMPPIKLDVLRNVVICFTGVIPQGVRHDQSDIGLWAMSFGAVVNPELDDSTTHVVGDLARRTSKIRQAALHPHIKIVDKSWLQDCFSVWRHVPEEPFLIRPEGEEGLEMNGEHADAMNVDTIESLTKETAAQLVHQDTNDSNVDSVIKDDNDEVVEDFEEVFLDDEDDVDLDNIDFDALEAELAEESFSDSDEDDDDDAESSSTKSNSSASRAKRAQRKRKRTDSDAVSVSSAASGASSDAAPASASAAATAKWKAESELQRRKKRALERTSSLTRVQNAADELDGAGKSKDGTATSAPRSSANGLTAPGEDDDDEVEDEDESADEAIKAAVQRALIEDADDTAESEA